MNARRAALAAVAMSLVGFGLAVVWFVAPPAPIAATAPPAPPAPPPAVEVAPAPVAFAGLVLGPEGPLANARITAGSASTTTDAAGRFVIEAPPGTSVRVDQDGYTTAWARGVADRPLRLTALRVGYHGVLPGDVGGTLTDADGMTFTLPPGGARTADGAVVNGPIAVEWTVLRRPDQLDAAPGDLATLREGAEVPLQSFGMVEIVLRGPDGQRLELARPTEITLPLVDGQPFDEGQSVGLYAFDPPTGLWRREGEGVVRGGRMVATITSLDWWNCDEPLANTGCVCGHVRFEPMTKAHTAMALRTLASFMTNTVGQTDGDDRFCVDTAPSRPIRVRAWGLHGDACFDAESPVVTTSGPGTSWREDADACAAVELTAKLRACADVLNRAAEQAPTSPSGDQIRLRVWLPERVPPYTDVLWRCGDEAWKPWPGRPDIDANTVPTTAGRSCAIRFSVGPPFEFTTTPGTTAVFCNVLGADSGCEIGAAAPTGPANQLHVAVWSAKDQAPYVGIELRCGDREFAPWLDYKLVGGGVTVPIEPDLPCELRPVHSDGLRPGPTTEFTPHAGPNELFCDYRTDPRCSPR